MIADSVLDQLLGGADAKSAFEAEGLLDQLKKALAERVLNAEMDHHLVNGEPGNSRNGYGRKTVTTGSGKIELEIPRDRAGGFDPALAASFGATAEVWPISANGDGPKCGRSSLSEIVEF